MFSPIKPEIKAEILRRIKDEGITVTQARKEYGVSDKTIYKWLAITADKAPSVVLVNQLKRENDALYTIIGRLTTELKKVKKGRS